MMRLLLFREQLKSLYGKYEKWMTPLLKAVVAFAALFLMSRNVGFRAVMANPFVNGVLALFCGLLPWGAVTFVCGAVLLIHLSALSIEIVIGVAAILILMFLVYYVFLPGNSVLLLLVPVLFYLKVPYIIPICVGLCCGMTSVIPVSFGVILSYILRFVQINASLLKENSDLSILQRYTQLIDYLRDSKAMWLMLGVFCVVTVVVYLLRRSSMDRAWQIAISSGSAVMVAGMLGGIYFLNITSLSVLWVILGTVLSAVISFGIEFFIFAVDYSRTEYTQFEDDEYYYYVKAVPKISVTQPEVTVKKINRQKRRRGDGKRGARQQENTVDKNKTVPEARIFDDDK